MPRRVDAAVLIGGPSAGKEHANHGGKWPAYLTPDGARLSTRIGDRITRPSTGRAVRSDTRFNACYVHTKFSDGSRAYIYRVERSSAIVEV